MKALIKAIVEGITTAILNLFQRNAEKPKTAIDAQTPENIKRDWNGYIADELRNKPNCDD